MERFAKVAEFVHRELRLPLVLCGGKEERVATRELLSLLPRDVRSGVRDLVGQTSFAEWIVLTRGASFVFGNDSGYIHLAAAVGTQAFCIMGWHNHGRVFPYRLTGTELPQGYAAPILIEADRPPCAFCSCPWLLTERAAKERKNVCDRMAGRRGIYACVDAIPAELAVRVIRHWWVTGRRL